MNRVSHSVQETVEIAREWIAMISAKEKMANARIVGLSGNLGAGKTAFAKAVAKELGIAEEVTSPTFVIMKIYPATGGVSTRWKNLIHIDAYRLESGRELAALKWEQIVADPGNLVLIEWPEHVQDALSVIPGYSRISFEVGEKEGERVVMW